MTTAELLEITEDGTERWLIRGELRAKPSEFPGAREIVRNRGHAAATASIGVALVEWSRSQTPPRGTVYAGNVGVILERDPDTTVGVDVVYASADVVAVQNDDNTTLLEDVPTLAVEILSPNDTQAQIGEKRRTYLKAGVPLVWVVEPDTRTVTVYRPGHQPELFNVSRRLPEYPQMPGFAPPVAELFE